MTENTPIHVNYRDSKLTWLLKDSIGDTDATAVGSETLLIGCVSPSRRAYEETLSTLRFCSRARELRVYPAVVMDSNPAVVLIDLQQDLRNLRSQMAMQNSERWDEIELEVRPYRDQILSEETQKLKDYVDETEGRCHEALGRKASSIIELENCFEDLLGRTNAEKRAIENLRSESNAWKEKFIQQVDRTRDLQESLSQERDERTASSRDRIQHCRLELKKREGREAELKKELNRVRAAAKKMQSAFQVEEGKMKMLITEKDRIEREAAERSSSMEMKIASAMRASQKGDSKIGRYEELIEKLKLQHRDLLAQIERLKTEITALAESVKRNRLDNVDLQKQLEDNREHLKAARNRLQGFEAQHAAEIEKVQNEVSLDPLLARHEALQAQIESYKSRDPFDRLDKDLQKTKDAIERESSENRASLRDRHEEAKFAAVKQAAIELDGLREEIQRLVAEAKAKNRDIRDLENDHAMQRERDVQRVADEWELKIRETRDRCEQSIRRETTDRERKLQDVEASFRAAQLENEDLKRQIAAVENRIGDHSAQEGEKLKLELQQLEGFFHNKLREEVFRERELLRGQEEDAQEQLRDVRAKKHQLQRESLVVKHDRDERRRLLEVIERVLRFRREVNRRTFDAFATVSESIVESRGDLQEIEVRLSPGLDRKNRWDLVELDEQTAPEPDLVEKDDVFAPSSGGRLDCRRG